MTVFEQTKIMAVLMDIISLALRADKQDGMRFALVVWDDQSDHPLYWGSNDMDVAHAMDMLRQTSEQMPVTPTHEDAGHA